VAKTAAATAPKAASAQETPPMAGHTPVMLAACLGWNNQTCIKASSDPAEKDP
jgi:hypothetical protein